jgi:hypothetical protein
LGIKSISTEQILRANSHRALENPLGELMQWPKHKSAVFIDFPGFCLRKRRKTERKTIKSETLEREQSENSLGSVAARQQNQF